MTRLLVKTHDHALPDREVEATSIRETLILKHALRSDCERLGFVATSSSHTMTLSFDLVASLFMGAFCVGLLTAHRLAGAPNAYRRVTQQGSTFFLGFNLMHAGYWMLQPAVRRCTRAGLKASVISWFSLVPAIAAAVAAGTGHWGSAAWCLLASALLDVLDGAVARARGEESAAGAVIDSVLDRYAEFIFFSGLFIYYQHQIVPQLIALMALLGSFLVTYSTAKAEAIAVTPPRGWMKRSDRLTVLIVGTAFTPLSMQWFENPLERHAWPVVAALTVIAVMANISAIVRFAAIARDAGQPEPRERLTTTSCETRLRVGAAGSRSIAQT